MTVVYPTLPIRCPSCDRLLAVRLASGAFEIRRGGLIIATIYSGSASCGNCGIGRVEVNVVQPDITRVVVPNPYRTDKTDKTQGKE